MASSNRHVLPRNRAISYDPDLPMADLSTWTPQSLQLKPRLVWQMALSSLKVRLTRTYLTLATIAAASAFFMFLLTSPRSDDPTERQIWTLMLVLSLLVSAAGVLNTMLMNVTQRYREIGTIKCLGALDSFVLLSVLVEAAILGLLGALGGIVGGLLLSVLLGFVQHGGEVLSALRFDGFAWKLLASMAVGMGLASFGAFVPALIASRMPPIEAMRGEK